MEIEVVVPLPLFQTFNYRVPSSETIPIDIGTQVWVPFKNRKMLATVVALPDSPFSKSKEILGVSDVSNRLSPNLLRLFQWLSTYYATPLGEVIRSATLPLKMKSEGRMRPLASVQGDKKISAVTLPTLRPLRLTEEQQTLLNKLEEDLLKTSFAPYLLHGVTGSGKTEVYLNIVEKVIQKNKEAIILVPEISLTPQLISRFEDRFPNQIAVLHSRLTPKARHQEWLKIRQKKVSIVVGVRSAVFAPFENLGIIIVDEEHDSSFKQEQQFRYHARDVALVRGQFEKCVVLLGSATPSLETYFNSEKQKIGLLTLPQRIDNRPFPEIELLDLKKEERSSDNDFIFSKPLLQALTETLNDQAQAILFINRRGFAPFLLCQECGFVIKCQNCSIALTVYQKEQSLLCHHCAYRQPLTVTCQQCQGKKIFPIGLGTEKVEEQLKHYFPDARIGRLDRSSIQRGNALLNILSDFAKQKIDILIGTQMVAKGHDFPNVTLVGVILADISLNVPDFRSPERTFQLLTQVAGRAGRGEKRGRVIVQTYTPSHYSLQFAKHHDYEGFYKQELKLRKEIQYPPFSKIALFKTSDTVAEKAIEKINRLKTTAQRICETKKELLTLEILGPVPAPLSRIKNRYRFHLMIKSPDHSRIKLFIAELLKLERDLFHPPAIKIDVDPLNLL